MTDDVDLKLRDRLAGLSAAVPLAPMSGLAPVQTRRVRARPFAFGAVPILAVVVGTTLLAGLARVGPFAPSATSEMATLSPAPTEPPGSASPDPTISPSPNPTPGPPSSTVADGDFEFTLGASKARFETTEMIDVLGELMYRGPEERITIRRSVWGPIEYAMAGLPGGVEVMHFSAPFACTDLELRRDVPYRVPLRNFKGIVPQEFHLPAGMWEVRGSADFHLDADCRDPGQTLSTRISFEVEKLNLGVRSEVDDGTLRLALLTPRRSIHEGDPISVFTSYRYLGQKDALVVHHLGPTVVFHLDQLDAAVVETIDLDVLYSDCTDERLRRGDVSVPLGPIISASGAGVRDDWIAEHFDGSKLRLPIGRWRITAFLVASTSDCVGAQSPGLLRASIDVEVLPEDAGGIHLLTATEAPKVDDNCPINTATGTLAVNSISGLGLVDARGNSVPVRWPIDFAAEQRPEGAVLYDWLGFRFAREGEELSLSGSLAPDGLFEMCTPVGIVNDPVLPILP